MNGQYQHAGYGSPATAPIGVAVGQSNEPDSSPAGVQELARLHGECENLLLQIGGLEERLGGVLSPPGPVSGESLQASAPKPTPSPVTLGIAGAASS